MTRKEEINKEANNFANTVSIGEEETAKNWSAFISGAEWADKTMLDRVCNWLKENMCFTTGIAHGIVGYQCAAIECFINDLRKAAEEYYD